MRVGAKWPSQRGLGARLGAGLCALLLAVSPLGPASLLRASAAQAAKKGTLIIKVSVDGATVRVDGRLVGTSPLKAVAVGAGGHRVQVTKPGFRDVTKRVRVSAGGVARVTIRLKAKAGTGTLAVLSNVPRAIVSIDGHNAGVAPYTGTVAAGNRWVVVEAAGYAAFRTTVTVRAGKRAEVKARLQRASEASPLDDPLALAPLSGAGEGAADAKEEGEGAAAAPTPAAADPFALVPLTPLPGSQAMPGKKTKVGKQDPLALTPLPGIEPIAPLPGLTPIPALEPLPKETTRRPGPIEDTRNKQQAARLERSNKLRASRAASGGTPWYKTWWFWTGVGVAAAGAGVAAGVLLTRDKGPSDGRPDLDPECVWVPGQPLSC